MQVIKGKVKINRVVTVGVSNNTAQENKKQFVEEALADYVRRSRSKSYCLRLMAETRQG